MMLGMSLGMLSLALAALGEPSFRQPGEFEPQSAVWMSAESDKPDVMRATVELVRALQPAVRIKMLLADDADVAKVKKHLGSKGVHGKAVQYFTDKGATLFMRDATVFTVGGGRLGLIDFKWSLYGLHAWCDNTYQDRPKLAQEFKAYLKADDDGLDEAMARFTGAKSVKSPLLLENATIEVNGKGTVLISERLAKTRHPMLSKPVLESSLKSLPGIKKVIWLDDGAAEDPHMTATISGDYVGRGAGGHTDEFVRFVDAHTIMLSWVDDPNPQHPVVRLNKERMQRNYAILKSSTDQDGKPFKIIQVPMPSPITRPVSVFGEEDTTHPWNVVLFPSTENRQVGDKLSEVAAASYLNFIIANNVVVVPSFVKDGTPPERERAVRQIFIRAFPNRKVRFVWITPLTWHGGGAHCATLNEPLVTSR